MVKVVNHFNEDNVPNVLKAYKAKMSHQEVNEPMRLQCFLRVVGVSMYEEVKRLQKAHDSWESFEEALLEMYDYEEMRERSRYEFDLRVASIKTHQSTMHAFL